MVLHGTSRTNNSVEKPGTDGDMFWEDQLKLFRVYSGIKKINRVGTLRAK